MILVVAGWGIRYVIIGELHEVVCRRFLLVRLWFSTAKVLEHILLLVLGSKGIVQTLFWLC